MKQLFIILIIGAVFHLCHGNSLAENWGAWQDSWGRGNQPEKKKDAGHYLPPSAAQGKKIEPKSTREECFCSFAEEGALRELLDELKNLEQTKAKQAGRQSVVRQKYRIARKLRKYDDCRAEDALKKLIQENSCEGLGDGEFFCVAWGASLSLQEIKSKKDLKKLIPATPLAAQLKIFKKYGPHPHENEFASHAVMEFLISQAATNSRVYIPLLVEYFTTCHEIVPVILNYPAETIIGLKRCLYASDPTVVWAGIYLTRTLGEISLFEDVYDIAFANKSPLDYSQQEDMEAIRTISIAFFKTDEKNAIPYYRNILYGNFSKSQEYIVSGIKDLTNPDLLNLLKEFAIHLQYEPDSHPSLLEERLKKKISRMEASQP